ncbi:hypothetical protein ACTXG6_34785 [Pseudonocardia sp. Cha107L01]|uniref:hypothetical protein n=1 Tax=Pseudonocardia sp. Cha107L01 TaxID=3457576 RepID=UPI00403E88CB
MGMDRPCANRANASLEDGDIMAISSASTSEARPNPVLIWSTGRSTRGIAADSDEQYRTLYQQWNAALSAQLDYAIEFAGSQPMRQVVAHTWSRLAREYADMRAVAGTGSSS